MKNASFFISSVMLLLLQAGSVHAETCWTPSIVVQKSGYGESISLPKYKRVRAAADATEALLRSDAALSGIDGHRLQLRQFFNRDEQYSKSATAEVWLRFHEPDTWGASGCTVKQGLADYHNTLAIQIKINDVSDLMAAAQVIEDNEGPKLASLQPDVVENFRQTGVIRTVNEGVKVFRADGGPVLIPLTVSEHLAMWEKRLSALKSEPGGEVIATQLGALRRHKSGLPASELNSQVQLPGQDGSQMWSYAPKGDSLSAPIYQVAPELLKPAGDVGAVRLVSVGWYEPSDGGPAAKALEAWVTRFTQADADKLLAAGASR